MRRSGWYLPNYTPGIENAKCKLQRSRSPLASNWGEGKEKGQKGGESQTKSHPTKESAKECSKESTRHPGLEGVWQGESAAGGRKVKTGGGRHKAICREEDAHSYLQMQCTKTK